MTPEQKAAYDMIDRRLRNTMDDTDYAEYSEALELLRTLAEQLEPCIGNDQTCPCQDGDACHYKDTPTTKGWPLAEQPAQEPVAWCVKRRVVGEWQSSALYGRKTEAESAFQRWKDCDIHPLYAAPVAAPQPLSDEQQREIVKGCGLDWHRGYTPLFDGDPTNRYSVLIEEIERAHGILAAAGAKP